MVGCPIHRGEHLQEATGCFGPCPCLHAAPQSLPPAPAPHLAEKSRGDLPPSSCGANATPTPQVHFSSHPSPSPRPPLQPDGKRSPERSPTTFPLESAASAFGWRNHLECITGGRESREQENVSWPPRLPSTGRRGSVLFRGWAGSAPHFPSPWRGQIRDVPGRGWPAEDSVQASGHEPLILPTLPFHR